MGHLLPGVNQSADSQSMLNYKYCRTALVQSPLTSVCVWVCVCIRETEKECVRTIMGTGRC